MRSDGSITGGGAPSDLRSLLGLLRRQSRLIALTIVVILGATGAVLFSLTPSYQATSLILVDPSRKDLLSPEAQMTSATSDSAKVDSEVEILKSDGVLMEVIDSQSLIDDPEFGVRLGFRQKLMSALRIGDAQMPTEREALGRVLANLREAVSIRRRGLTYLIAVGVQSTSPEKAATLADAFVDAYIKRQVASKIEATLVARNTIRDQIDRARLAVIEAETQYIDYVADNLDQLIGLTGQADLRQMRDLLRRLAAEQQDATNEAQSLRQGLEQRNWSLLTDRLETDAARALARQRNAVFAAIGRAEPGSSQALDLQQELEKLETSLADAARTRVTELESTLSSGKSQLAATQQALNATLLRANLPPDIRARIYELLQISGNATTNYQTLLSRLQNLETQALLQVADSRIVSPALPPASPSFPNTPVVLALAGLFAVSAGVGLGVLFDVFIGGFVSADQLRAVTGRRAAAIVPLQRKEADSASVADTLLTRPVSRYAESLRRLRASIDRSLDPARTGRDGPSDRGTVIMVTSALPGEGKTTLALSLARTYAAEGHRVLLVDCDFRRPSLHKQLGIATAIASLPDFLNGKLSPDDVKNIAIKDPRADLKVILGKRDATSPSDQLLNRRNFAQFIRSIAHLFDYIVLDSPPIEPVVDGLYLAEHVDAIALVIRAATTPQFHVVNALAALDDARPAGTQMLLVLNQEPGTSLGDYGADGQPYLEGRGARRKWRAAGIGARLVRRSLGLAGRRRPRMAGLRNRDQAAGA